MDVVIRTHGHAGRLTLNRPRALNALTLEMVLAIERALISWKEDPAVELVVIDAEGEGLLRRWRYCGGSGLREGG